MKIAVNDLTLVILAHESPEFLARSIDYYARLQCRKVIVDSSAQPSYSANGTSAGYDYRHVPKDYYAKQRDIAETIDTPYTICAGCDDFFVPEAIAALTEYLRHNPEYVVAAGQHIGFQAQGNGYRFFLKHSVEYLQLLGRGATDNVFARINAILLPQFFSMYSVMRTSAYRSFVNSHYAMSPVLFATLNDRHFPLFMAALGNLKMLPEFFSARSVVAAPVYYNSSRMQFQDVLSQWPEGAMEEYTRVVISVATALQTQHGLPMEEAIAAVDGALRRTASLQFSWSSTKRAQVTDIGQRADQIDAQLRKEGKLIVPRRDRFGMPFPEAERMFPVYGKSEHVREIVEFLKRHPVEVSTEARKNA